MIFGSKKNTANGKTAATAPSSAEPATKPSQAIPSVKSTASTGRPEPSTAGQQVSEEAKRRATIALQLSAAFAQIVTVLLRSPQHKHLALADLEWLVYPPLTTGQFAIANLQKKEGGVSV